MNACRAGFGWSWPGHIVTTVQQAGFAGVKNGELLRRLVGHIDALVTVDKNIPAQQSLSALPFGVVIVRAKSNRIEDLRPLAPALLAALVTLTPGQVATVS
jgi:hypothetical protein